MNKHDQANFERQREMILSDFLRGIKKGTFDVELDRIERVVASRKEEISVTPDKIIAFAEHQGWSVGYDNDDQIILYTGVFHEDRNL